MKKMKQLIQSAIILTTASMIFYGCGSEEAYIQKASAAITKESFEKAEKFAQEAKTINPASREADIILTYVKYEEYMLHAAFWVEDTDAVKYLAKVVKDVDSEDPRYNAPLIVLAAAWGREDMVKALLDAGSNPNSGSDKDGLTALMWAAKNFNEQYEMVKLLIDAGAKVNVTSKHDETPLSIALEYNNPRIAELLRKNGATH